MEHDEARFWSKVDKTDGCWEWTGTRATRPSGQLSYGSFRMQGHTAPAHRVAWEFSVGSIPPGKWLLHKCDNQGCVRPDHLYVGTHADNTRDAVIRRRMFDGERTWNHKLRDVDIRAIRALLDCGFTTEAIGQFFGVSGRTIRLIRSGERWKHVT